MASRNVKLGIAALALAIAGGITANFKSLNRSEERARALAQVEAQEVANHHPPLVESLAAINSEVALIVSSVEAAARKGEGIAVIDTSRINGLAARAEQQLGLALSSLSEGDKRILREDVAALQDLASGIARVTSDVAQFHSYINLNAAKISGFESVYERHKDPVSLATALSGFAHNLPHSAPSQHPEWPPLVLRLYQHRLDRLIHSVFDDKRWTPTEQQKEAFAHILATYPDALARLPVLKRYLEKAVKKTS